jgi:DNA-binding transcriptional regulator YiaG
MAKNFSELRAKMVPERRTRNSIGAQQILQEIALAELRQTKQVTQAELADRLDVNQAAVSKLEGRCRCLTAIRMSSFTRLIEAYDLEPGRGRDSSERHPIVARRMAQ